MTLVTYSDSDSGSSSPPPLPPCSAHTTPKKRKRLPTHISLTSTASPLPPLPASFYNLYATSVRTSTQDDPCIHGGRQRAVLHVEGNWPTHIYIECKHHSDMPASRFPLHLVDRGYELRTDLARGRPSPTEAAIIETLISQHQALSNPEDIGQHDQSAVKSLLQSELGVAQPLHISLSQSLNLRANQRESFATQLHAEIYRMGVLPFAAVPLSPIWTSNYSKTRDFLVLPLAPAPDNSLDRLLAACNTTAVAFAQSTIYAPAPKHSASGLSGGARKRRHRDVATGIGRVGSNEAGSMIDHEGVPAAGNAFHVSIAWRLAGQLGREDGKIANVSSTHGETKPAETFCAGVMEDDRREAVLKGLRIEVNAVKAKIGNAIVEIKLGELGGDDVAGGGGSRKTRMLGFVNG